MNSPFGLGYGLAQMASSVPGAVMRGDAANNAQNLQNAQSKYQLGLVNQATQQQGEQGAQGDTSDDPFQSAVNNADARYKAAQAAGDGPGMARWQKEKLDAITAQQGNQGNTYKLHEAKAESDRQTALKAVRVAKTLTPGASLDNVKSILHDYYGPGSKDMIDKVQWESNDKNGNYSGRIVIPDGDGNLHAVDLKGLEDELAKPLDSKFMNGYMGNMIKADNVQGLNEHRANQDDLGGRKLDEKSNDDAAKREHAINVLAERTKYHLSKLGLDQKKLDMGLAKLKSGGGTNLQVVAKALAGDGPVTQEHFRDARELLTSPNSTMASEKIWSSMNANNYKFQKLTPEDQAKTVAKTWTALVGGKEEKMPPAGLNTPAPVNANPAAKGLY